jgi:hypothetical protein
VSVDLQAIDTIKPAYIVIKIDYQTKLILPFRDGMTFLEIWSMGIEVVSEFNKPDVTRKAKKELTISFMSETEFKQMKMSSILDSPP